MGWGRLSSFPTTTVPTVVAPQHPHAWITLETRRHPAIILDWTHSHDANGYPSWHARCLYWRDNHPDVVLVPQMRVSKA